jgi:hypothetical protein
MAFAKTNNYGGGGRQYKNFKLQTPKGDETTDNKFRILPAKGVLADSGTWRIYIGTHFGYKVADRGDPTKLMQRTFKCVEVRKNGVTTEPCPECDLIADKKAALERTEQQLKASGKSEEEIKMLTAPAKNWLDSHNCDRKWHMLVVNEALEPGVLQISHKCKVALDERIKELIEKKVKDPQGRIIDPLDFETGVFFNFRRKGKGINVIDTVEIVKKTVTVQGEEFEKIVSAPISVEVANKLDEILPDLPDVVRAISREQVAQLVKCNGDPEEVEAIFKASEKHERSGPALRESTKGVPSAAETKQRQEAAAAATSAAVESVADEPNYDEAEPVASSTPPAAAAPADDPVDAELAALQAQMEALKAKKSAPASAPQSSGVDPKTLSHEKFADMFKA